MCANSDPVAALAMKTIVDGLGMAEASEIGGYKCFAGGNARLIEIPDKHILTMNLDLDVPSELFVFPSVHVSSKGIASFTTHPEGNWSAEAKLGGKPSSLSVAAPIEMLAALNSFSKRGSGLSVSYEATHHGPLLDTPSLFVEVGGTEEHVNPSYAGTVGEAVMDLVLGEKELNFDKIAVGIGSGHYPSTFTALALEGKFAFSHIMSKYYVANVEMLDAAFNRSKPHAEVAVIEWKGIKSGERKMILDRLNELGIDYVRI